MPWLLLATAVALGAPPPEYSVHEVLFARPAEATERGQEVPREAVVILRPLAAGAKLGPARELQLAREASFWVQPIEGPQRPRKFTLVTGEGPSCVAEAVQRVAVSVDERGQREVVGEGALLTGCPIPELRYATWALAGSHPGAVFLDGVSIRVDELRRVEATAVRALGKRAPAELEVESAIRVGEDKVYLLSNFEESGVWVVIGRGMTLRLAPRPLHL